MEDSGAGSRRLPVWVPKIAAVNSRALTFEDSVKKTTRGKALWIFTTYGDSNAEGLPNFCTSVHSLVEESGHIYEVESSGIEIPPSL